jgi:succinoglycan biosynthesis transport protein ExoP
LAVQHGANNYTHWLTDILPILWRRRRAIYVAVALTSAAAFLFYSTVGERYESYTLLRVGQGIKDRSTSGVLGEGPDLTSRIESLARIATTDQVIRLAASEIGFNRLFKKDESSLTSAVREWLASDVLQALPAQFDFLKPGIFDFLKPQVNLSDLISAKAEGRTDILRLSFRHPDQAVAAQFLNELANALIVTQADLVQIPAEVFFQHQTKRLEQEAEKAGTDLRNFSVATATYSVEDQRNLLLQRAGKLSSMLASTRSSIEDRKGQKQAILDQLVILRPGSQSEDTPPLVVVKVYQDAMANLVKVNTDLNGSLNVEKELTVELDKVNKELASLSSKQAEYDRLKRELTRASAAAEDYGSRVIEERLSQDIAQKAQLSSVRVVQRAEKSALPMFPRAAHLVLLALVGGIALGSAFAVMLEFTQVRRQEEGKDEAGVAIEEVVRRSVRNHLREIQAASSRTIGSNPGPPQTAAP